MKNLAFYIAIGILAFFVYSTSNAQIVIQKKYIVEKDSDIAVQEPGPHHGGGFTTGYSFFSQIKDLAFTFRKRVLQPGSSIGYHLQEKDEIYYILSGRGEMKMNNETFPVGPGDCVLTRPGNSHGLKPAGSEDLVLIIVY